MLHILNMAIPHMSSLKERVSHFVMTHFVINLRSLQANFPSCSAHACLACFVGEGSPVKFFCAENMPEFNRGTNNAMSRF